MFDFAFQSQLTDLQIRNYSHPSGATILSQSQKHDKISKNSKQNITSNIQPVSPINFDQVEL